MKIKFSLFALLLALPLCILAQDYVMFRSLYVQPKSGHAEEFGEEIREHNMQYHKEAPTNVGVFSIVNGPRTGQLVSLMGPITFTQMDKPMGEGHGQDWRNDVLPHAEVSHAEFWVREDDLSIIPENDGVNRPLHRVRFFEVADNDLFMKVQRQIMAVAKDANSGNARIMFRKRFMDSDKKDWAVVSFYENWAELDQPNSTNFQDSFKRIHGAKSWDTFVEEFDKAVISREDEFRNYVPWLSGDEAVEN